MRKKLSELNTKSVLSREQMKKVKGGFSAPCGVKIDGVWYESVDINMNGATKDDAIATVANGTASAWCCASCPWNQ